MKLSIRKKILLVVANALVLMVVMAGVMGWQFHTIQKNKSTITLNSEALRSQMEADMMHDALRADALAALHTAHHSQAEEFIQIQKDLAEHVATFRENIKANQERALAPTITAALRGVDKPLEDYILAATKLVETASKDLNTAEVLWPAFSAAFSQLEDAMASVSDVIEGNVKSVNEASHALYSQFYLTIFIALGLAVTSLSFVSWRVTRSIVTALDKVGNELNEASGQLTASSNEVSTSSRTLAESASQQAASLEETSASLEEVAAMTKRNAESAASASLLGSQASKSATAGGAQIAELNRTLTTIKAATHEMQAAVNEMQSSSQEVAKIIKTIDEIAFQTNLLALNAAVEAARAGEAGAGFAVVADEVRSLAQRSAQAAKDTAEKIEGAVKRSEAGGDASAKVVKSLVEVETTARNIQQVFAGISGQIKSLDEVISQIAAASQEQTAGISEVNMAVNQLDRVTQSNASGAEDNASSAHILKQQSVKMLNAVETLHVIVTGKTNAANTSSTFFAAVPNDRDNAAFAFGATRKTTKPKATATHEFQNF